MQNGLDAHARPPQSIQDVYKQYQKEKSAPSLQFDIAPHDNEFQVVDRIDAKTLNTAFQIFIGDIEGIQFESNAEVLESKIIPGIFRLPSRCNSETDTSVQVSE